MVQPKQTTTEHIESPDEIENVIDDLFDGVSAPAKPKVTLDQEALTPDSGDVTNDSSSGYQHKDRRALFSKFSFGGRGRGGSREGRKNRRQGRQRNRWGKRR